MIYHSDFQRQIEEEIEAHASTLPKLLRDEIPKCIILSDYSMDKKLFRRDITEKYFNLIRMGYEHDFFRNHKICFKCEPTSKMHHMPFKNFVTNTILWLGIIRVNDGCVLSDDMIFTDFENITIKTEDYINKHIILPHRAIEDNVGRLSTICHDVVFDLGKISTVFNRFIGNTMNMEVFIDLSNRFERFDEILHTTIDEREQPAIIEEKLKKLTNEHIRIIVNDEKGNILQPMFKSKTGIKVGQYQEFAVNGGLKPDLSGSTIPLPQNTNFIRGGMNTVATHFIDAMGGRKPLIMNQTVMGKGGHFSRKTGTGVTDFRLAEDLEFCGTKHTIQIQLKSKDHVNRYKYRHYHMGDGEILQLVGNEKHLIGETIYVYSPILCAEAGTENKGICKRCYGGLYATNKDYYSVGGFAAAKISNPIQQGILSTKHLLMTLSALIEFQDIFYEVFELNSNEIVLKNSPDIGKYTMIINKEDMVDIDDVGDYGIEYSIKHFIIRNNETKKEYPLNELTNSEMYVTETLRDAMNSYYSNRRRANKLEQTGIIELPLSELDSFRPIFIMEVVNHEQTKPLYDIMSALDSAEFHKKNGLDDVHKLTNHVIDLLIETGNSLDGVHIEMIITPLIRSIRNILERPDFKKYDAMDDITIVTYKKALTENPSPTVSMSSIELRSQLISQETTWKKHGKSYMDPMFRETLSD